MWAWVDEDGLHVDGQDLGLPSGMMGSDGEYEYFRTVHAADVPQLIALLGGLPNDDILDLLFRNWSGSRSNDLERIIRDAPFTRHAGPRTIGRMHTWRRRFST